MLNIWNRFAVKFCFDSISDKVSDIKSEKINYLVFCLAIKFAIWYGLPLSPHCGHWWRLEAPDGGFASWSLFWYDHWSLIHPYYEDCLSIFILKVQRTSLSFMSWFWALEDAGGSWLGFGSLIMIWIWYGTLLGSSLKFSSHSD